MATTRGSAKSVTVFPCLSLSGALARSLALALALALSVSLSLSLSLSLSIFLPFALSCNVYLYTDIHTLCIDIFAYRL